LVGELTERGNDVPWSTKLKGRDVNDLLMQEQNEDHNLQAFASTNDAINALNSKASLECAAGTVWTHGASIKSACVVYL